MHNMQFEKNQKVRVTTLWKKQFLVTLTEILLVNIDIVLAEDFGKVMLEALHVKSAKREILVLQNEIR